jgi:hypothetical protein
MTAPSKTEGEESPGFIRARCRITSCRGNSKESATETYRWAPSAPCKGEIVR